MKKWTEEEDAFLRANLATLGVRKSCQACHCGEHALYLRAGQLCLLKAIRTRKDSPPWTEAEVEKMRSLIGVMSWRQIARVLGKTHNAVMVQAGKMGVERQASQKRCYDKYASWPAAWDETIRTHLHSHSCEAIGCMIGQPGWKVIARADALGLARVKPDSFACFDKEDTRYGLAIWQELAEEFLMKNTVPTTLLLSCTYKIEPSKYSLQKYGKERIFSRDNMKIFAYDNLAQAGELANETEAGE